MRAIKFQCWDEKNHTMWDVTDITWRDGKIIHIRGDATVHGTYQSIGGHADYVDIESYLHLRQYTGLNDSNGKEIYEGDILEKDDRYVVCFGKYDEGDYYGSYGYGWHLETVASKDQNTIDSDLLTGYTVIGSIYQNPELLEAK